MSTIREKFVDRMTWYGLSEHTQRNYVTGVKGLAEYFNLPPDQLIDDQVRAYFRHLLTERKLEWTSCKNYLSGITYFYRHICDREVDDRFGLPPRPRSRKLPAVLSMEEVARLLSCVDNLKHRVILKSIYSAGLRIGEAVSLMPEHIESDPSRMVIRVEQGKGRKDRYTVLSKKLLLELKEYWVKYSLKQNQWLFPGQKSNKHITTTSVWYAFDAAKKKPA
jgi:integrase/recombinase XerD